MTVMRELRSQGLSRGHLRQGSPPGALPREKRLSSRDLCFPFHHCPPRPQVSEDSKMGETSQLVQGPPDLSINLLF